MIKEISKYLGFRETGQHRILKGRAKQRELVQGTSLLRPRFGVFLPDVTGYVGIHVGAERCLKGTPESVTLALRVPGPLGSVSEEGQTRLPPTFLAGAAAHSRKHLGFGAEILVLRIGYMILGMQLIFPDQSYSEN